MKKILFVNACVRKESRTRILAEHVLKKLEGTVEEVNLEQENIKPLNAETLEKRNIWVDQKDFSAPLFKYAKQFAEADEIVIAAPYWDLGFPSTVRIYLEAITVTGLVFKYTPEGTAEGLCKAKHITYVTTAGGPIMNYNLGYDYVKALADIFYGIPETRCYAAENLDIMGADVNQIMEATIKEIDNA
ncbi:MAG: NAD(P)H-dependent oxidoreductase [Eubacterium sp.]